MREFHFAMRSSTAILPALIPLSIAPFNVDVAMKSPQRKMRGGRGFPRKLSGALPPFTLAGRGPFNWPGCAFCIYTMGTSIDELVENICMGHTSEKYGFKCCPPIQEYMGVPKSMWRDSFTYIKNRLQLPSIHNIVCFLREPQSKLLSNSLIE